MDDCNTTDIQVTERTFGPPGAAGISGTFLWCKTHDQPHAVCEVER